MDLFETSTEKTQPVGVCPKVVAQCQQTLFDNPIKLITLAVCSICFVYIVDLAIKFVVKEQHYKVRPKRRAILQAFVSNVLLIAIYLMGTGGLSSGLKVDVVSVMLVASVILGLVAVVNGSKDMDVLEGSLFVAVEAACFYMFYHFTSKV